MALKRLPSDLTFDAVRNQTSPFAKPTPRGADTSGEDAKAKKNDQVRTPVSSEPAPEAPVSDSNTKQAVGVRKKSSAIDEPADVASPQTGSQPVEPQSKIAEPEREPAEDPVRPRAAGNSAEGKTVTVKGRISPPADGVTPIYDSVKARYDEKAALKHLITVALESYSVALLAGDETAQEKQPGFASLPPSRASFPSRVVSRAFHDAAKAHIDPLGIMSPSGLSTAIIQTALEWYVARNPVKN